MSSNDVSNLKSSNSIINIIVVIDTDSIIRDFTGKNPSQDANKPTGISHQYSYMVVSSGSALQGQASADLNIKANVGDVIRWTGTSESDNFDSSVLVYGLPKFGGTDVFTGTTFKMYTKTSMLPKQNGPFPVTYTDQSYWFIQADINQKGTENYQIQFGLYYRPDGGAQQLFGYFCWDPTITVSN
ncbi:inclusion body family protein [Pectobacterium sp. A5351]|uniref:inclusion body family protein n=1 Tax=Pectobacterium sp. A5351 TaxID=2914983 RepID=UPI00232C6458|nr:inclusion body family protein [Pectobacterium sp. A5351]WCG84764.1 inclusion body family protein [Pectobacterium sp. A5351]